MEISLSRSYRITYCQRTTFKSITCSVVWNSTIWGNKTVGSRWAWPLWSGSLSWSRRLLGFLREGCRLKLIIQTSWGLGSSKLVKYWQNKESNEYSRQFAEWAEGTGLWPLKLNTFKTYVHKECGLKCSSCGGLSLLNKRQPRWPSKELMAIGGTGWALSYSTLTVGLSSANSSRASALKV